MEDKRLEGRLLCADLVGVQWQDGAGHNREATANLEDISALGACLQLDVPIRRGIEVQIRYPKGELEGIVKYCVFREVGYFIGVNFQAGSKWSRKQFKPKHLLDLRRLAKGAEVLPKNAREEARED